MLGSIDRRDAQHVIGAHARGQQRLVGIAKRRVGQQQRLLFEHPLRELFRAQFLELVARAGWQSRSVVAATGQGRQGNRFARDQLFLLRGRQGADVRIAVAIDDDLGDVGQNLGRPVLPLG